MKKNNEEIIGSVGSVGSVKDNTTEKNTAESNVEKTKETLGDKILYSYAFMITVLSQACGVDKNEVGKTLDAMLGDENVSSADMQEYMMKVWGITAKPVEK